MQGYVFVQSEEEYEQGVKPHGYCIRIGRGGIEMSVRLSERPYRGLSQLSFSFKERKREKFVSLSAVRQG